MLAERLKLIRQARGLTMEEVAERMGGLVTKQAISKYESGSDRPSSRVLLALARALNVPPRALETQSPVQIEAIAFRKRAKLPVRERERLESCLAFRLEQAVELRDLVFPGEPFEVPARALKAQTPDEAEARADELRSKWNLGSDPIGNVVDLLEEKGITVCFTEADGAFDGLSAIAKGTGKKARGAAILCRAGLTCQRQRLNAAHELAHVVLEPSDDANEESFAWRFAGAFLAPRRTLLDDVGAFRRTVGLEEMILLKQRYGMSIQALLMRLRDLEVITNETSRAAFIALNRMGLRRSEPGDSIECEQPQWLRRTALRAVGEGLLSASEASEILGEPVEGLESRKSLLRMLAGLPVEDRVPLLLPSDEAEEDVTDSFDDWIEADVNWSSTS